jgi:hypothetical protein
MSRGQKKTCPRETTYTYEHAEARHEEREDVEEAGLLRRAEDSRERLCEFVPAGGERAKVVAEAGEPDDVEGAVREVRLSVDLKDVLGADERR